MTDWIDKVILSICEMCRDSGEYMPEAMLVTPEELRDLIQTHMPNPTDKDSLLVQPAPARSLQLRTVGARVRVPGSASRV